MELKLRQSDDKVLRRLLTLMKKEVTGGCIRHIIRTLGGFSLHRIRWNVPGTEPQGTEVFSPDTEDSVLGVWILGTVNVTREGQVSVMPGFHWFYCIHIGEDCMGRRLISHSETRNANKMLIEKTLQKDTNCDIQVTNSRSCTWCLTIKNRASYIKDGRTATLQMLHFMYFFNNYKYWVF